MARRRLLKYHMTIVYNGTYKEPSDVTINQFAAAGGTDQFEVDTNYPWSATSPEWITMNPMVGSKGETIVTITANANIDTSGRNGYITIKTLNGRYTVNLSCSQMGAGNYSLVIEPDETNLAYEGTYGYEVWIYNSQNQRVLDVTSAATMSVTGGLIATAGTGTITSYNTSSDSGTSTLHAEYTYSPAGSTPLTDDQVFNVAGKPQYSLSVTVIPQSVEYGGTALCTATLTKVLEGVTTHSAVTPTWSLSPNQYGTITTAGTLTNNNSTNDDIPATVTATYTVDGQLLTANESVTLEKQAVNYGVSVSPTAGFSYSTGATSTTVTVTGINQGWTFDGVSTSITAQPSTGGTGDTSVTLTIPGGYEGTRTVYFVGAIDTGTSANYAYTNENHYIRTYWDGAFGDWTATTTVGLNIQGKAYLDGNYNQDITTDCIWSSDDDSMAVVNPNTGLVHAIGAGVVDIYAEYENGLRDYLRLDIEEPEPGEATIAVNWSDDPYGLNKNFRTNSSNGSKYFDIVVSPEYAKWELITYLLPNWVHINRFDSAGTGNRPIQVTWDENRGETTRSCDIGYYLTDYGLTKEDRIYIIQEPHESHEFAISLASTSITVGNSTTCTASFDGNPVTVSTTFASSDSSIATVNGNSITGVSTGTVTITGTYTNSGQIYTATATLSVTSSPGPTPSTGDPRNWSSYEIFVVTGSTTADTATAHTMYVNGICQVIVIAVMNGTGEEIDVTDDSLFYNFPGWNDETHDFDYGYFLPESVGTREIHAKYVYSENPDISAGTSNYIHINVIERPTPRDYYLEVNPAGQYLESGDTENIYFQAILKDYNDPTYDFNVTINTRTTWSVTGSGSSYCSIGDGSDGGHVKLLDNPPTDTKASAKALYLGGGVVTASQEFDIIHADLPTYYITAYTGTSGTDTAATVNSGQTAITVSVYANQNWTGSASESWVSISPSTGTNDGTVTVSISANTGNQRQATITFTGGSNSDTCQILITQRSAETPTYSITADFGSENVTSTTVDYVSTSSHGRVITENQTWGVFHYTNWIERVSPSTGGQGTTLITISYGTNLGDSARTATIIFTGGTTGNTQLEITQEAEHEPVENRFSWHIYNEITSTSINNVSADGEDIGQAYYATGYNDLNVLTIIGPAASISNRSGDGYFNVTIPANLSESSRTFEYSILNGLDVVGSITIEQNGASPQPPQPTARTITIEPDSTWKIEVQSFPSYPGSGSFEITGPAGSTGRIIGEGNYAENDMVVWNMRGEIKIETTDTTAHDETFTYKNTSSPVPYRVTGEHELSDLNDTASTGLGIQFDITVDSGSLGSNITMTITERTPNLTFTNEY